MFKKIGVGVTAAIVMLASTPVASAFSLLSEKDAALLSGQYDVELRLPEAERLQELMHAGESHGSGASQKLTYKSFLLENIAPFLDGKIMNMSVSMPSNFVAYDYDGTYIVATESDHDLLDTTYMEGTHLGAFEVSELTEVTVTKKGEFTDGDTTLSVSALKKEGATNVKLQKGTLKGTKGYFAASLSAEFAGTVFRGVYLYDPESEKVFFISYYEGEEIKKSSEIWENFVKSVFAKTKVKKDAVVEAEPYENSLYTINPPTGWRTCECETESELYLMDTVSYNYSAGSFTPNIYITAEVTGETPADLKWYIQGAKEMYAEEMNGVLKSAKMVKTKNGQGVMIEGEADVEGIRIVSLQLVVIADGVNFILTAVTPKNKWKEYEKGVRASLLSFKAK